MLNSKISTPHCNLDNGFDTFNSVVTKVNNIAHVLKHLDINYTKILLNNERNDVKLAALGKKFVELDDKLKEEKMKNNTLNQYGRRECLELIGIIEPVAQSQLKTFILELW